MSAYKVTELNHLKTIRDKTSQYQSEELTASPRKRDRKEEVKERKKHIKEDLDRLWPSV